jgi:hypothetical protein
MKQTLQITQSNFTVLVMELEDAVKNGYTLIKEGENRPYHAIMGNFIVTLEKEVDEEVCNPVYETTGDSPTEVNTEVNTETDEIVAEESEAKVVQTPAPKNARKAK